ncbi:MAG: ATP phosphoribosyltransferase regulatory subunit, partial [Clostridia bacterium]|nr:ATP phosphoribosyltransferase regulatory subunit [Clostridia bacterium]
YILQELPLLIGNGSVIEKVKSRVTNKSSLMAVNYLEELYNILSSTGFEKYISFDLGVIGSMDYYTGLIFRGYAKGTGSSILDGGRYDNMVEKFGIEMPAVGFALKVNDIIKILESNEKSCADYLLAYDGKSRTAAFKKADELRKKGFCVVNGFIGADIEKNRKYALNKNIPDILYFEENSFKIINSADGSEKEAK